MTKDLIEKIKTTLRHPQMAVIRSKQDRELFEEVLKVLTTHEESSQCPPETPSQPARRGGRRAKVASPHSEPTVESVLPDGRGDD